MAGRGTREASRAAGAPPSTARRPRSAGAPLRSRGTRARVLAFVRRRLLAGAPPSVREVQRALRFRAVQSAQEHLQALVAEGQLAKESGQARGFRLPGARGASLHVPLLGRVQAGGLEPALESLEGYVPIEAPRGDRDGDLFALRVRGDSMSGTGILDGDLVIVRRQRTAQTGEVVVALVDGDATVKRFYPSRGRIELRPENPAWKTIVVQPPDELVLLGRVIEVRRYLDGRRA